MSVPPPLWQARQRGVRLCLVCHAHAAALRCPRCGAVLHRRKPDSLARTWALLLAAMILYIPANVLPIMTVTKMGHTETSTIWSGILSLGAAGMWPLALLVFFASLVVPLVKIALLVLLTWSAGRRSRWRPRLRTQLYRFTEAIGQWSMVDIFLVSLLSAVVDMEAVASIEPEPGATWFGAVVVLTMLAARSFDPRLIWDPLHDAVLSAAPVPVAKESAGD
ncbi:MAG: paraquat-inducible protein A [Magnetococcus sp. WYHC-3]